VFFSIFTAISLAIPTPMFPGNWFCDLIGEKVQDFYARVLSAAFNGAFYGGVLATMFVGLGKKLEH
jgi:hypothetical protein